MKRSYFSFMKQLMAFIVCLVSLLPVTTIQAATEDTLTSATAEIPFFLDPTQKMAGDYWRAVGASEALTKVTPEGEIELELAEAIDQVDEHTWQIKLRPNVTFWSGKVLDSKALIASMERFRSDAPDGESLLDGVHFDVVDEMTVKVTTDKTNYNVPINMTEVFVMNAEMAHDSVETTDMTGMYRITEYIPREKTTLVRYDGYWGQKPTISNILWLEMPEAQTRKLAAINGDADIVMNLEPTQVDDLKKSEQVEVYNVAPSGTLSVYVNLQKEPWNDLNLRQALNWSLDRQSLSQFATEGLAEPSTTWLGSNPQFKDEQSAIYHQDLNKAQSLIESAGWKRNNQGIYEKDGQRLTFTLYTFGSDRLLGEAIQNQWLQLGVDVALHHVDYSLIEQARQTGEWDGLIETWNNFGDPYPIAYSHFGEQGSANYGHYQSEVVNKALAELNETSDAKRQHELLSTINLQVAEDSNLISLMPRPTLYAVNKRLKGYMPHFLGYEYCIRPEMTLE